MANLPTPRNVIVPETDWPRGFTRVFTVDIPRQYAALAISVLYFSFAPDSLLFSQAREKRVTPLPSSAVQGFENAHGSVGVAILAGVGKYPKSSGFGELQFPQRDVSLLDKELTAQHYKVISLTDGDATKESILNAIASAGELIDPSRSKVIFFFSGHGYSQGSDNMLATSDASATKLSQTGLSLRAVEEALIGTKAQQRMLWIDACRNEPGKGVGDARTFTKFEAAAGTRVLFSTKFGRVSYEDTEFQQGVFSHYLVAGLHGAAAKDDGWISFRDLADFVTDQVQTRTWQQGHPQVPYEGTGQSDASGDFPVARTNAVPPVTTPPRSKETLSAAGPAPRASVGGYTMPDFIAGGKPFCEAYQELRANHIKVTFTFARNTGNREADVARAISEYELRREVIEQPGAMLGSRIELMAQQPKGGETLAKGGTVNLVANVARITCPPSR
jgi:hypothetical protein